MTDKQVEYSWREEHGIHHIDIHDPTLNGVRATMTVVAGLFRNHQVNRNEEPFLLILDYRTSREPPVSALRLLREFYRENPPPKTMYVAYLFTSTGLTQLLYDLLNTLTVVVRRRVFTGKGNEAAAIQWLVDAYASLAKS